MDPRERADAALARARARGAFVVTPEDAISPMDAASTLQIPRTVVAAADGQGDPESTMVVPHPAPPGHQTYPPQQFPQHGQPGRPQAGPPYPQPQPQPQVAPPQHRPQQHQGQQPVQAQQNQAQQGQAQQGQQRQGQQRQAQRVAEPAQRPQADAEVWPPEPRPQQAPQPVTQPVPQAQPQQPHQPQADQGSRPGQQQTMQPQRLDGLVPTVKQPPPDNRPSLAQRLEGQRGTL